MTCWVARDRWILPFSRGWRKTSRTSQGNSGNSSKNSTPSWASEISPDLGAKPPPTNATLKMSGVGYEMGGFLSWVSSRGFIGD